MADSAESNANIFKTPQDEEGVFENVEGASPNANASSLPTTTALEASESQTTPAVESSESQATPALESSESQATSASTPASLPALRENTPVVENTPQANTPVIENTPQANVPKPNSPQANVPKPNTAQANVARVNVNNSQPGASPLSALNETPVKQNKTKKRRSTKQREADQGQKNMLDLLRGMYNEEFADIPEKYRPKPKAYVARAAYYKKEGPERDKYIESWLLSDRTAADARMGVNVGKKRLKETANFSNEYVLDTLPSIVSEATGTSEKFHPSMDTLKERAKKAVNKMNEITDKAHDGLMKRIKQPVVRKSAVYLFKETRKLIKRLGGEINTQARHLQQAAKNYIDRQKKGAQGSLEKKAEANLTIALGQKPNKRMTHRLTRLRNTGKGINIKNFLNVENKAGRLPKTIKKNWRKSIPEGTAQLNDYANND